MKLESNYSQGDRVTILVVSLFSLILFFRLHLFITVIPFECWTLHEIWEYEPYYLSPIVLYSACLGLFLLWALVELFIGIADKSGVYVIFVSALSAGTVLFLMVGFFHFWQFFQIEKGTLPKEAYFWKIGNITEPLPPLRNSGIPTWREYVVAQRCDKGLAISTMTYKERIELNNSYWALYGSLD